MDDDVAYQDWMSEADALLWRIERDPQLRSTAVCLWVVDQPPDRRRLEAAVRRAVHAVPRLRQRVIEDPYGIAPPKWQNDSDFDIRFHVRYGKVGGEGTLRDVLDFAGPLAAQAFDKDRPLWEYYVLEGYERSKAVILMKLHHSISDGMGFVKMMFNLVTVERDDNRSLSETEDGEEGFPESHRSELGHFHDAVLYRAKSNVSLATKWARAYVKNSLQFVTDPFGTMGRTLDTTASVARLLKPAWSPMSPIMSDRSRNRHFETLTYPVTPFKEAAASAGGTLNDGFLAAVLGGLHQYHETVGAPIEQLRVNMPINIRDMTGGGTAGNYFVPMRFLVPLDHDDPQERIEVLHDLIQEHRSEPSLAFVEDIQEVIARMGPRVATTLSASMMKAVDFVATNMPGPAFPIYIAGAKVLHSYAFGPLAGAAVSFALFSYDGQLHLGINLDPAAVEDRSQFIACVEHGFEEVLALV